MFKITIEGATMAELATNALALAAQFQTTPAEAPEKPARAPRKAATAQSTADASGDAAPSPTAADDTDRELLEEVPPAPATANSVVDAGTGQPVVETKKVTMDDIRKAATDLAGKDTAKLASLIKANGGTKLSDIPPANLPAFAAAVFEAVGLA